MKQYQVWSEPSGCAGQVNNWNSWQTNNLAHHKTDVL